MNNKTSLFKHVSLVAFCFLALTACSCTVIGFKTIKPSKGTSEISTEFKSLHSVSSGVPFNMVLTQKLDETPSITMVGPNNYIESVEIDYADGRLVLRVPPRTYFSKPGELKIKINVHDLRKMGLSGTGDAALYGAFKVAESKITSSGTGDFMAPSSFEYTTLNISCSGTGDVKMKKHQGDNVKVRTSGTGDVYLVGSSHMFEASTSGTGDVHAAGTSQEAYMKTNGTGDIEAKNLVVQVGKLRTSGTGDIDCGVAKSVDASTSGTGDITVYGRPEIVNKNESGTGDIDFVN